MAEHSPGDSAPLSLHTIPLYAVGIGVRGQEAPAQTASTATWPLTEPLQHRFAVEYPCCGGRTAPPQAVATASSPMLVGGLPP